MSDRHEGNEIELFDLGNAIIETRQWSVWPTWYDSVFIQGERQL